MEKPSLKAKIGLVAYVTLLNLALVLVVNLVFGSNHAATAALKPVAPKAVVQSDEERNIALVAKASPAVVSILAEQKAPQVVLDGSGQATVETGYQEAGRGTGFLVSADGLIVTNRHVVGDRAGRYTVFLADDRQFPARIIDLDPIYDLALIKIDASGLPHLDLAPTDGVRVGQDVIAIGNALGKYSNTVTRGILSGVNRSLDAADPRSGAVEQFEGMLQTDAAINSGNSGGPLLDSAGRVIGVNTAVEVDGSDLGFAIPAAAVRADLVSYAQYGSVSHPRLGIRYVMVTPEVVLEAKLPVDYGAFIYADPGLPAVIAGSPAAAAGLKPLDVILEINGVKVAQQATLTQLIQKFRIGDHVRLKVQRGTAVIDLEATLDGFPPYGY